MPKKPVEPEVPEYVERPPSKSARKRAAHEAQDLGETLISLRDAELDALDLPETLADAIREAKRIPSRGGGVRQRQYIGKLMRELDLEPIRSALYSRSEKSFREAEQYKRVEEWRERLIVEGPAALDDLDRQRPGLERAAWAQRIDAAQTERARIGAVGAASRELFRALRALFESTPGD